VNRPGVCEGLPGAVLPHHRTGDHPHRGTRRTDPPAPQGAVAKLDLLVLDELGYVPVSKVGAELLFDVISTAYERTSLIVTSNLPFESWTEVLGSERLTGATLDRLTHRCRIIETKGKSYWLQDAKSRTARVTAPRGATGSNGTATMPVDGAQTTK